MRILAPASTIAVTNAAKQDNSRSSFRIVRIQALPCTPYANRRQAKVILWIELLILITPDCAHPR